MRQAIRIGRARPVRRPARAPVAAAVALLALVAVAGSLVRAAPARAAAGLTVGMEDERLLLTDTDRIEDVVRSWAAAGVDTVRIHARWSANLRKAKAERVPAGFDATDPGDRRYDWHRLDRAVDLVVEYGMKPMLTITGPAPWWGTADPSARNGALRPRSAAFGRFARAVAERYGDRVDTYMIWNEPNQPGWLMPQNTCTRTGRRKTCTPTAPGLYRPLVRAAVPQIRRADPRATILMGELAPIGQNPKAARSPIKPLTFLRELACVDAHYRKRTTGDCARFKAPAADGIGYHPHGRRQPPDVANRDVNEAQLADLSRLLRVLDRLSASRRLLAPARTGRKFDVYLTEFGFQTFPPDPGIGVTLDQQVRYIQQAAYIAWSTRRVRNLTHYQWEDERLIARGNSRYGGWQSGLRFVDGRPKPALGAFEAPFVADTDRGRMWGQIRPGAGPYAVTLWRRAPGQADFAPLNAVPTDRNGYWTAPIGFVPGTAYRFTWTDPTTGTVRVSGDLTLSITGRGLQTAGPAPPQPPLPLPVAVAALPAPDATPTPTAGPAPAPAPAS